MNKKSQWIINIKFIIFKLHKYKKNLYKIYIFFLFQKDQFLCILWLDLLVIKFIILYVANMFLL